MTRRSIIFVFAAAMVGACAAPRPARDLLNPDPAGKIPAFKHAASHRDMGAAKQMVEDLDSDDPAVRFYAIEGLRKLSGETHGYRYFDDEFERKPAIKRWRDWLNGRQKQ